MGRMKTTCATLLALAAISSCGPTNKITGALPSDETYPDPRSQSETRITVTTFFPDNRTSVVAYNDETQSIENGTIVHSGATRLVYSGASEAGFSYSTNDGTTWTYGGTIPTITGWPVIWSDPGAASSLADGHYVFLSYLAVPAAKFPTAIGFIDGAMNNFIGGACIMRSTDGGQHFAVYQCFQATDANPDGDFYDGTTMTAGSDGAIYFATNDVNTKKANVWWAPNATSTFQRLPDPFVGLTVNSHVMLRSANAQPYLLAPVLNALTSAEQLMITRFVSDGSGGGNWTVPSLVASNAAVELTIAFSGGPGRHSEEFGFDVGSVDAFGDDAVRVVYTTPPSPSTRLATTVCKLDLSSCKPAPGWSTTADTPGDQFGPTVRFFNGSFSSTGPIWKLAWQSRQDDPSGNTFDIEEANLILNSSNVPILIPLVQATNLPVCTSTTTQYWGDYDDLGLIGLESDFRARFIRTYTDSTYGCLDRTGFSAWHQHVSGVIFP